MSKMGFGNLQKADSDLPRKGFMRYFLECSVGEPLPGTGFPSFMTFYGLGKVDV